jgi:hypothetical protein
MKTGAERGELVTLLDERYQAFLFNYLPSPPSAPASFLKNEMFSFSKYHIWALGSEMKNSRSRHTIHTGVVSTCS